MVFLKQIIQLQQEKYNISASVDNQKLSTNLNDNPNVNLDVHDGTCFGAAKLTSNASENKAYCIFIIAFAIVALIICTLLAVFLPVEAPVVAVDAAVDAISSSVDLISVDGVIDAIDAGDAMYMKLMKILGIIYW